MTKFGRIAAILNERQLVLEIEDGYVGRLEPGMKVVVFAVVNDASLTAKGLPELYSPKGEIRIVMQQAPNIFLAERYMEGGHVETRPVASFEGLFTREVRVGARWSADIDTEDSLNITFERNLKTGDVVGIK